MTDSEALQLILGPDKRNPCFCLYVDVAEKEIHVYYGLEVLEVVPNDPRSPAYRLLGARLYNAGLRVRTLEAVFGLDRKTLRKWGLALRSGDRKWLAEVLAGRSGRRKLTLEMESYVRFRWLALRAEGRRDYRQRLQEELERVFGVRVSGETLRPLLRQLRGGCGARAGSAGEEAAGAQSASVEPTGRGRLRTRWRWVRSPAVRARRPRRGLLRCCQAWKGWLKRNRPQRRAWWRWWTSRSLARPSQRLRV